MSLLQAGEEFWPISPATSRGKNLTGNSFSRWGGGGGLPYRRLATVLCATWDDEWSSKDELRVLMHVRYKLNWRLLTNEWVSSSKHDYLRGETKRKDILFPGGEGSWAPDKPPPPWTPPMEYVSLFCWIAGRPLILLDHCYLCHRYQRSRKLT